MKPNFGGNGEDQKTASTWRFLYVAFCDSQIMPEMSANARRAGRRQLPLCALGRACRSAAVDQAMNMKATQAQLLLAAHLLELGIVTEYEFQFLPDRKFAADLADLE